MTPKSASEMPAPPDPHDSQATAPEYLQESNDRLKAMLEALPDLLFVLDRDGRICDFHAPIPERLYVPPEQFLGRTMNEVLPEPAAGIVNRAIADAVAHGHHRGSIYPLHTPAGEQWFEISIAAQGDPLSPAGRLVAIVRDITERKRAEDALRQSEHKYRLLTEGMKDVVWTVDVAAQRFLYVSPSVAKLRGYTPEEILAQPFEEALVPEQRRELAARLGQSIAEFQQGLLSADTYFALEILQPCQDGSRIPSEVLCHLLRNEQTGRIELHGVTRDIADRKQMEESLRESESRFAQSAKASHAYVWEVDVFGVYTFISPVVQEVLGYAPDEIVGKMHFYDFHPPEGLAAFKEAALQMFQQAQPVSDFENLNLAKEGRRVWVSSSAVPLFKVDGSLRGYQGVDIDITARKQAAEALKTSETRYRELIDFAVDGILLGSHEGIITQANACMCALTGRPRDELIGKHIRDLLGPECAAQNPLRFDLVQQGATVVRERQLLRPDGSQVFVEMHSKMMPDGTYQSIFRDITARKLAEAARQESEAKYRRLHEGMRDAFVSTDMQGHIQDTNPAFRVLTGYPEAEIQNLTYFQLTPAKWHAREAQIVAEQVLPRGYSEVYQKEYIRRDGSILPVELRTILIRDSFGNPSGMWAIVRDITERKRVERALQRANDELERRVAERTAALVDSQQALKQSEEQFRQMTDIIQEVFWLIDAQTGHALYVSPAFEAIWGRPPRKEAPGVSAWAQSLHPDDQDRALRIFRRGLETGQFEPLEVRVLRPDRSIRWIEVHGWMLHPAHGEPLRVAGVMRDITERRRLETEILCACEVERQRIGRDLHDSLGQVLTGIGYLAEALRGELARHSRPEAADAKKLGRLIVNAASQAHAMARGMLLTDLHRGGLATALQELALRTQELFGIPCRYEGLAEFKDLAPDATSQLYRIAQEAATNAAKHAKAKKIEIRLDRSPAGLLLTVRDSGTGLAPKNRKRAGLGLDIMKYRANQIGATLDIASSRNQGTTVTCRLPLAAPPEITP